MDITNTDLERVTSDFITMVSKLGLDATAEAAQIEGRIHLNVRTPDPGRMIGRRGKTLAAIQLLLNGMARRDKENFPRVFIDIDGYRSEGKGRFEHPKSEDGESTEGDADADAEGADASAQDGEAIVAVDSDSSESEERDGRDDRPRRSRRPRRRSSRGADAAAEVTGTADPAAARDDNESSNDANRDDSGSDDSDNDGDNGSDEQADGDAQPKRRRRSRRGGRRQRNKNARANGEERGEPRADGDGNDSRGDSRNEARSDSRDGGRGDSRNESRNDVPPPARRAMERREELPPLPAPPETITVQRAPELPAATIEDVPPGPPAPPTVGRGPVGRSERGGRDGRRGRGRRDSRDGDRGGFREDSQAAYEVPRPAMASPEPVRRAEPMDDNERLRRLALDAAKEVHMWGEEKLLPPLRDEECQVVFEALSSHLHVSAEPGPKINDGRVRIVLKEKKH